MNKTAVGIAALLGALVIGWGGGTWFYGQRAKSQSDEFAKQLVSAMPIFTVTSNNYEPGFLKSTQTVKLKSNLPLLDDAGEFTIQNVIEHGPIPGFSGVGAARITHNITYPPAAQAFIKDMWGDKTPLSATTVMGLGGGGTTTIASPAFSKTFTEKDNAGTVAFKGLDGKINFAAGGKSIDYTFSGPGLDMTTPTKDNFKFGALSMTGKQDKLDGTESLYVGPQKFTIAGVEGVSEGKPSFTVQKVDYDADVKSAEQNFVDIGARMVASGLKAMDTDFGNVEYVLSAKRLHAPSVDKMNSAFKTQTATMKNNKDEKNPAAAMKAVDDTLVKVLKEIVPEITKHNPTLTIDRIRVGTDKAFAMINATLKSEPLLAQDLAADKPPLGKFDLVANAEITDEFLAVAKSLALRQMQAQPSFKDMPPDMKKEIEKQAGEGIDQQLAQLVQQGFLKREAGKHTAQFTLKKAQAQLNGKAIPLPGL